MRSLVCIATLLVLQTASLCQDFQQLKSTVESMASTFNFEGDTLAGATCFMTVKDGKQYFVTAAHLFRSSDQSGEIVPVRLLIQNELRSFDAKVYFHPNRNVDVAVFKLAADVSQKLELPQGLQQDLAQAKGISLDSTFLVFGSPVFFYGFPLTNLGTQVLGIKFPLMKKAILSGWIQYDKVDVTVLDGHNNHGFSGGPVVAYDSVLKKMCVVGVISGNLLETRRLEYKGDKLSFDENSGIILCYSRRYIEDIFAAHKKALR